MKIFNVSYHDKDILDEVYAISGKPFGFWAGLKRGGTGTPRGTLAEAPEQVLEKFRHIESIRYCSLREMQEGMLLYFNRRLETYAIPVNRKEIKVLRWRKSGGRAGPVLELTTTYGHSFAIQYNRGYIKSMNKFLQRFGGIG